MESGIQIERLGHTRELITRQIVHRGGKDNGHFGALTVANDHIAAMHDLRDRRERLFGRNRTVVAMSGPGRRRRHFAGGGVEIDVEAAIPPGIRQEFIGNYMVSYKGLEDKIMAVAFEQATAMGRFEKFVYPESSPHPARQPRFRGPKIEATKYVPFEIEVHAWGVRVPWGIDDEADDRTGTVMKVARGAGENFALLKERCFFQIIQGQTDVDLLPNEAFAGAPDGAALYSASDGAGNDRFGVSGGNTNAGTSSPTADDVRSQFYDFTRYITRLKDTKGLPLLSAGAVAKGVTIFHGPSLNLVMREAFKQRFVFKTAADGGLGAIVGGGSAAPSNVILDADENITVHESPYITDDAIYFFLNGIHAKPLVMLTRRNMYEVIATEENSDWARDSQAGYLQFRERWGMGLNLPFGTFSFPNE